MFFLPLNLQKAKSFHFNPDPSKNLWKLVDSVPYLQMLNLYDLVDKVYVLSIWIKANSVSEIHKDQKPTGQGVKWSIVVPIEDNNGVTIEVFKPKDEVPDKSTLSMAGGNQIKFLKDCEGEIIDVWNCDNGSMIFDAYNQWHRVVNRSNAARNIISIRSSTMELRDILFRLSRSP